MGVRLWMRNIRWVVSERMKGVGEKDLEQAVEG